MSKLSRRYFLNFESWKEIKLLSTITINENKIKLLESVPIAVIAIFPLSSAKVFSWEGAITVIISPRTETFHPSGFEIEILAILFCAISNVLVSPYSNDCSTETPITVKDTLLDKGMDTVFPSVNVKYTKLSS